MTIWLSGGRDQTLEILKKATEKMQKQFEGRPYYDGKYAGIGFDWYVWLETTVLLTEVRQMLITIS